MVHRTSEQNLAKAGWDKRRGHLERFRYTPSPRQWKGQGMSQFWIRRTRVFLDTMYAAPHQKYNVKPSMAEVNKPIANVYMYILIDTYTQGHLADYTEARASHACPFFSPFKMDFCCFPFFLWR